MHNLEYMLDNRMCLTKRYINGLVNTARHLIRELIASFTGTVFVWNIEIGKDAMDMGAGFDAATVCAENSNNRYLWSARVLLVISYM